MSTTFQEPARHPHLVEITVNGRPVNVLGPKATGLQIKEAAVEQGVSIQVDFVLSEVRGHDRRRVVGDDDLITVNKRSEFVAVAPDDNS